jgi:peptidyl-prolyl cis-trans isomerase B (cyclophilin B)
MPVGLRGLIIRVTAFPPDRGASSMSYVTPYPQQQQRTNTMGIVALILAFVMALPMGIIFGHIARSQIRRTGEQGSALATAALWISYIYTALTLAAIVFVIAMISSDPSFN